MKHIADLPYEELSRWIADNIDLDSADPVLVQELIALLEDRRKDHRTALWQTDPSAWAVDNLGDDIRGWKWSLYGEDYQDHDWDSRRHWREKNFDDEFVFPYEECRDPIHEIGLAVARYDPRIAVPSGTGVSKTWCAARLLLWWLARHEGESKVITFAAKQDQLRINLWAEVERLFPRFKLLYPKADLHRGSLRLYMDNTDESAREVWSARGYGAAVRAGEGAAGGVKGSHSAFQFNIFEEGQSSEPAIVRSVMDGATGRGNIIMMLGNPLGTHDALYQFCTKPEVTWISISAMDFPNVVLDQPDLIPGAAEPGHIRRVLEDVNYDENHPDFLGPIRGVFPMGGAHAIISNNLAEKTRDHLVRPDSLGKDGTFFEKIEGEIAHGYVAFWRPPRTDYLKWCYIAMDLAGDDITGDYHVAMFFDRVSKEFFGMVRMRGDRSHFFQQVLYHARRMATFWAEKNSMYLPLISWERNFHSPGRDSEMGAWPNVYRPIAMDTKTKKMAKIMGHHTNKKTRTEMVERLKEWLLETEGILELEGYSRLYIPDFHYELTKFIAHPRQGIDEKSVYAAAAGFHDDVVMGAGQALFIHAEHAHLPPIPLGQEVVILERKKAMESGWVMGSQQPAGGYESVTSTPGLPQISKWVPKKW